MRPDETVHQVAHACARIAAARQYDSPELREWMPNTAGTVFGQLRAAALDLDDLGVPRSTILDLIGRQNRHG